MEVRLSRKIYNFDNRLDGPFHRLSILFGRFDYHRSILGEHGHKFVNRSPVSKRCCLQSPQRQGPQGLGTRPPALWEPDASGQPVCLTWFNLLQSIKHSEFLGVQIAVNMQNHKFLCWYSIVYFSWFI